MARALRIPRLAVDPAPLLARSTNPALAFFAQRDLLRERVGPVEQLWELPGARAILGRQQPDGRWRYGRQSEPARQAEDYDQLETFRQAAILVEKFGFTRAHPALARAAEFLLTAQTRAGDLRGIYGNQYATTYVGAVLEIVVKAGYAEDPRVERAFDWLLSTRQRDGGWAIPLRTLGVPFSEFVDAVRHPTPLAPDRAKPSSHLVTGMVLRAFAAHPARRRAPAALEAGALLASRLYQRDAYGDRGDPKYWERVSFPFWFTDVVSALDSLGRLGLGPEHPAIAAAMDRVARLQDRRGTFAFKLLRDKDRDLALWIALAVARAFERFALAPGDPQRR